MINRKNRYLASVYFISLCFIEAANAATYSFIWNNGNVTDLGNWKAVGINNYGDVIGGEGFYSSAVLWSNGVKTYLNSALPETYNYPYDINNSGQIVGMVATEDSTNAVLWTNGSKINLGFGIANDINDSGNIVGTSFTANSNGPAFLWYAGARVNLKDFYVEWDSPYIYGESNALKVNNSGQSVGKSSEHAALWDQQGNVMALGPGIAKDINDSGQVVGRSEGQAFLWSENTMLYFGNGTANDINELGQVVGSTDSHAFVWSNNQKTDFGIGEAYFINESGQVVGQKVENGTNYPFIWTDGTLINLTQFFPDADPGSIHLEGLNDAGQIVGWYTAVPLPSAYLLMSFGITMLASLGLRPKIAISI